MKKNLLSKLSRTIVMLATCLSLFIVILPFGIFTFGDNSSDANYDSLVSTLSDDPPEYIKNP